MVQTEHKMSKEVKEKLFGLLPMSEDAREQFTPEVFTDNGIPEEYHPVFTLRQFTIGESNEIRRALAQAGTDSHAFSTKLTKIAHERMLKSDLAVRTLATKAVDDWDNFHDIHTGALIEYDETAKAVIPTILAGQILSRILVITGIVAEMTQGLSVASEDEVEETDSK